MNIHIMAPDGVARVRPDTTLNRLKEDYYVPDGIGRMDFTPAVFAHISKAGKAVNPRFAGRYMSAMGFGLITYPDGGEFYDFTSLLSMVEIPSPELEDAGNHLMVFSDGESICDISSAGYRPLVEKAIVNCSRNTSLRIGDFVAAEIGGRRSLPQNGAGRTVLKVQFGDILLFETGIIHENFQ